jgi:hypothetical protein
MNPCTFLYASRNSIPRRVMWKNRLSPDRRIVSKPKFDNVSSIGLTLSSGSPAPYEILVTKAPSGRCLSTSKMSA